MPGPEEKIIQLLKDQGVDFTSSLPCEKIKNLLLLVQKEFYHLPLTREEEGVGISAGAALAGKRPAMFIQSSGIGNMINALLSLTRFYELPLALFVSRRGVYREKIAAQVPMGLGLPKILRGAHISHTILETEADLDRVGRKLKSVYRQGKIHAFLLSPALWEYSDLSLTVSLDQRPFVCPVPGQTGVSVHPELTRYGILEVVAPFLEGKIVVSNLGWPSKELYAVKHQQSNFYMLGSMGMATPIGLGISLSSNKEVVVIDGDGSLLMNPGTLASAAHCAPGNLTILAIDNSSYGSTGSQETHTGSCVDLELVARGFGIADTVKAASREQLAGAMSEKEGLRFIHALALPGNRDVPNIPLDHLEVKRRVQESIRRR